MAYVIWRIVLKKYSRIRLEIQRHPSILVNPSKGECKRCMDDVENEITGKTDSQTKAPIILCTLPPSIDCNDTASTSLDHELNGGGDIENGCKKLEENSSRLEVRRSKSRVRSYLKRCKDRLTGHHNSQQDENCMTDCYHEPIAVMDMESLGSYSVESATSSWYVDEVVSLDLSNKIEPASSIKPEMEIPLDLESITEPLNKSETVNATEKIERGDTLKRITDSGVDILVDRYLSNIYPNYFENSRMVLIRQARDVLVCTYHGCLYMFEEKFLKPFAEICQSVKNKHAICESVTWCKEWPLATETGDVILHLGALDESLVRPSDIYICVRPGENTDLPELCAVWRGESSIESIETKVNYRKIDCDNYLSPLYLEMLTDDLPQLLQNLLIGLERAIGRIPLNDLTFPNFNKQSIDDCEQTIEYDSQTKSNQINNNNIENNLIKSSPKCALKRSELITKNKMLNNKYILRRLSSKYEQHNNSNIDCASNDLIKPPMVMSNSNMPLFCLGNSFPHIDSDEECPDDRISDENSDNQLPHEIVAPRSISELSEKLLTSGIHLPGTHDLNGRPIVTIDASCISASGLNCYEAAKVLLYYSTIHIPESPSTSSPSFTILIQIGHSKDLPVITLICNSLKLVVGHFQCDEILTVCLDKNLLLLKESTTIADDHKNLVKLRSLDDITTSISVSQLPKKCGGLHQHDQNKWQEFFKIFETFQSQCIGIGQRLATAMGDIRASDLQGLPTRRQLYAQHRALSRALMDSELHNLRKNGPNCLNRLNDLAKNLNSHNFIINHNNNTIHNNINNNINNNIKNNNNKMHNNNNNNNNNSHTKLLTKSFKSTPITTALTTVLSSSSSSTSSTSAITTTTTTTTEMPLAKDGNSDVKRRLNKVMVLFNEVDRTAKRLEQLTEQRRERLRELTRQRALEDEIKEVTSWIQNDGDENLQKFTNVELDREDIIKDHEHEFEKYYFVSLKHVSKGRDLYDASIEMDSLKESAAHLKDCLEIFNDQLEQTREKIEGAARLHHLLGLQMREEDLQSEMQRLAEKIGVPGLVEKCRNRRQEFINGKSKPNNNSIYNKSHHQMSIMTSTPDKLKSSSSLSNEGLCHCWREDLSQNDDHHHIHHHQHDDDDEDNSKIADSGLGGCDRCDGNQKLSRVCSCQSFDEASNLCDKSHNIDELDEDCYDSSNKHFLDLHLPIEANSHLQCHASNLELPKMEELSSLDPKIQKTLLLIIREMIGTERDYVRSLYYVIENYVDELLREDIPQPLRGQRNVIFGNIEKIFEFHQPHFLAELERYECNPLKVGAAFLKNESKFYLYALYNKNKPKSDTLMSEYGTSFFKSKQMELKDKMDLASYLLKPVQRMGKYALLLQQLVKACNNVQGSAYQEIATDVEELQRAEEMVKFQLRHGNDLLAMDSLRDCDVNVKEQGRLLRQNEFLVWQGRGGKKCLRQIFLFEELVLFSKARRFPDHKNLDIYIYKNSIKTSDIGLTAHVGDSPTKFEIWFRKRKPEDTWTMQSMSEDIKNAWTEEISKLLWKQAKRNREIRLAEMSSMGIGCKPCLDIRPSHNQISDRSITISQLGKAPKLRHSFAGTLPETGKTSRRPNSLISESSISSGTSSSSISTGSGSNSGKNFDGLELINEKSTLNLVGNNKKNQRSTTLVSQLSMESGIMSDISLTPDNESHEPNWPLIRKLSNTSSNPSDNNRKYPELTLAEQEDPYIDDSVTVHL